MINKGDKVIYRETFTGQVQTLTYTGIRREIKEVMFDFFTNEKGESVFFTPSEVENMQKI